MPDQYIDRMKGHHSNLRSLCCIASRCTLKS